MVSNIFSIIKIRLKMVFDEMAYLLYGKLFSNITISNTSLKRSVMTILKLTLAGVCEKYLK